MARILVVEEDAPLREVLAAGLTMAGHDVVAVRDGGAALQRAEEAVFDVALVQYDSPFLRGGDLRTALLDRKRWGRMHVIMTAARCTRETTAAAQAVEARALLRKPFRWEELKGVLEACLRPPAAESVDGGT